MTSTRNVLASMVLAAMAISTAGCSLLNSDDIGGEWELVTATVSDIRYMPDPTRQTPWIQVIPSIKGHGGCNAIRPDGKPPHYEEGRITGVSLSITAAGCSGTAEVIEGALLTTLLNDDGIDVTVGSDGETMTWESATGTVIEFVRH